MIRNAVIHITNEQPLLADLYEAPKPVDQGLLCTNIRTMDGRKPIFVDRSDSIFFFPYLHIRFLEIAATASDLPAIEASAGESAPPPTPTEGPAATAEDADADLELDEDFLRRIRDV